MVEKRHARLAHGRIAGIDHRRHVHAGRRKGAAHRITGRAVTGALVAALVETIGIDVEDFAERCARAGDLGHLPQRLHADVVHLAMRIGDLAEQDRPLGLHIVATIGDRVFDEDLVLFFQPARIGNAATVDGARPGIEQRRIRRHVGTLPQDRGQVGCLQVAVENTRTGSGDYGIQRVIQNTSRLAGIFDLGR
ncbi:hypothetical protein D3C73_749640 [compost metagenome]